jgi:hypothetical protein
VLDRLVQGDEAAVELVAVRIGPVGVGSEVAVAALGLADVDELQEVGVGACVARGLGAEVAQAEPAELPQAPRSTLHDQYRDPRTFAERTATVRLDDERATQ